MIFDKDDFYRFYKSILDSSSKLELLTKNQFQKVLEWFKKNLN